jgi:hypothetical protein
MLFSKKSIRIISIFIAVVTILSMVVFQLVLMFS